MSEDIPPQVRQQVERIQQVQERLQFVHAALHQVKQQLAEINVAQKHLAALADDAVIYQMAGSILFKTTKEKATKTLEEQAESLNVRLKSLEKQEKTFTKQFETLQETLRGMLGVSGDSTPAG
ncbi:MAG: prefoldin subunit beta [Promethearchaeota archaeon]